MLEASICIKDIEMRERRLVCSPEIIALESGFINIDDFSAWIKNMGSGQYRQFLEQALNQNYGSYLNLTD